MSQRQRSRAVIVEDDASIATLLETVLRREGFDTEIFTTSEEAIESIRIDEPNIVLLDHDLPELGGIQACREIRRFSHVAIVIVTAHGSEVDRVLGLTFGADDFIVKPFSTAEFVARVRAVMRRQGNAAEGSGDADDVIDLDEANSAVRIFDNEIDLTDIEFKLLSTLVAMTPEPVARVDLLNAVWGNRVAADDHVLDVHIHNLRRKLRHAGNDQVQIRSVRGAGFRFVVDGELRDS